MSELLEIFKVYYDASNPKAQEEATKEIESRALNAELIKEVLEMIVDRSIDIKYRRHSAVTMNNIIKNNLDFFVENANDIFNSFINCLIDETDKIVVTNVSHALCQIFDKYGEKWEAVTEFISKACSSEKKEQYIVGTIFLIDFIPSIRSECLESMHEMIIVLIQRFLNSNSDYELGFRLFAAVQMKSYEPEAQTSLEYAKIFQAMIQIFHQNLIKQQNDCSILAQCIAFSVERDVPFDSPTNFYQYLLEVASDDDIPTEVRHLPIFPIESLIEYHGGELKELIPQSIPIFLTISASQFQNSDYVGEDDSRTIINLFEGLSNSMNGEEFFQCLLSIISKDGDPAGTFASLCAIYGSSESLLEQFEQNMEIIVDYLNNCLQIESVSIIEISLIIFSDLVHRYSDSITPYISNIMQQAFEFAQSDNVEISKDAILLIAFAFENIDLDTSNVLSNLNALKEFYENSPLKSEIMGAIASAIYCCGEDFKPYANLFTSIVMSGLHSEEASLVISSVEALGYLIAYAGDQIGELYADGIELITENCRNEDLNMQEACLTALYNIINKEGGFNFDGKSIDAYIPLVLLIANAAIDIPTDEEKMYSDQKGVKPPTIIECGFLLFKALFKYHSEDCKQSPLIKALPKKFEDFMKFPDEHVNIKAIKASVYFMVNFQPEETELLAVYDQIINDDDEDDDDDHMDKCRAAFKAYSRLLELNYKPAINDEVLGKFIESVVKALNRSLTCQSLKCESEEERYDFDGYFMEPIYTILSEAFKISVAPFQTEEFLGMINNLLTKVDEVESIEILGTLGDFIMAGGNVNSELVQFAFNKLTEINYQKSSDSVYFIRALIKKQPELIAELVSDLVQFFIAQLKSEVSSKQFYWSTMTNIIAAVFELSRSSVLSNTVKMEEIVPLIMNKLPVQGDNEEAEFIYGSFIEYLQSNQNFVSNNIDKIFKVIILTLSLKTSSFDDYHLEEQTVKNLIALMSCLIENQPQLEQEIKSILEDDEVKLNILNKRMESFSS